MGSVLDEKSLLEAFHTRPDIQGAIRNAAAGELKFQSLVCPDPEIAFKLPRL